MRKCRVSLQGAAAAAALFLPSEAFSQSFTIDSGQAFIGNLVMADMGDIGIIISGGSVAASIDNLDAIDMANDNQAFENQSGGLLLQEGDLAAAVISYGLNAEIENFGSIIATGDGAHAIVSLGDNAVITNGGTIETLGDAGTGLISAGAGSTSRNRGSIRAAGAVGIAVILDGSGSLFENRGTIETTGLASSGLIVGDDGDGATVTNSGSIISPLDGASQAIGISPDADGVTLKLSSGSVIQGVINFAGTNGTVSIANGLNTALTFNLSNPTDLNTFGSPYATTAGNLLAVVDPTGFSAHDKMLADVTGAITGAVDERFAASRAVKRAGDEVWFKTIDGYRHAKNNSPGVGFDNLFNGLMIGVDRAGHFAARAGFFGGGTMGEMETSSLSQTINMQNYFAGGYASFTSAGTFFDFSAATGLANFNSDRRVANNLVTGGMEHAESSYFGILFSPSITIGTEIATGNAVLTPSVRLRYAALFLENYAEKGSAANLDIHGRRVDALELRGQIAASTPSYEMFGGNVAHALRVGADGYFTGSQPVDAVLLGQALSFGAGEQDVGARGFVGFETRYTSDLGWQFGSIAEFSLDTDGSITVSGGMELDIPL